MPGNMLSVGVLMMMGHSVTLAGGIVGVDADRDQIVIHVARDLSGPVHLAALPPGENRV